jgi:hypothetical protein
MLHEKQVAQEADIIRTTVDAEISKFHREPDLMLADRHSLQRTIPENAAFEAAHLLNGGGYIA